MNPDLEGAREEFARGWSLLESLPPRSKRSEEEKAEANRIREKLFSFAQHLARENRREIYDRVTDERTRRVRVDDLVYRAAELWPGLTPTREEVARESERMQADKDGREVLQGILVSELLSDREIGTHLVSSMLAPTDAARAKLPELMARGEIDLGGARVEARGEVGYVTMSHPRFLNAEDDETLAPLETAIDLVLLHPSLKMGVLRGGKVEHPKYAGRRIFSSGLNLTRLYHGRLSYLFYLVRDLGLVHKLYRGLALETQSLDAPETTLEKPWMAAVDGFAIGGGCQILLVVDYVVAEEGSYFNLPARKEGIIPGAANLRLPRFMGERMARQGILFDRTFRADDEAAKTLVNEIHPTASIDAAIEHAVENALGSGMVSASGNRKALRVQLEPLDTFRRYMATYAREQAYCHLSEQLIGNLEKHWQAKSRRL